MKTILTRSLLCGLLAIGLSAAELIVAASAIAQTAVDQDSADDDMQSGGNVTIDYKSPYSIKYTFSPHQRMGPDQIPPRDKFENESYTPADQWYSKKTLERYGAWGPEARYYPAPKVEAELLNDPAWRRQRLLTVGDAMIGIPYQHHHIPSFAPPADWPWKPVAWGKNSIGLDCSNFSSWLYNYGLGIKLLTNVHKQAEAVQVAAADDMGVIQIEKIPATNDYDALVKTLRSGDLLYIKNKKGVISHVIMWVGEYGKSPDGTPLVMDSTGSGHKDSNGKDIPVGIHLRPFTPDSWYFKSFSHANRIIH